MRRNHNNEGDQVILFLGECRIISLNNNHQVILANRTLLLKEAAIYTYQNPLSSLKDTKLSAFSRSKNPPIQIDKLINYQYEYKINHTMRAKLLIGRRDQGVQSYLKQLKIGEIPKQNNIVGIIKEEENCMNGFVFEREDIALQFYQSINFAIITQTYLKMIPESIPFNFRILNMLGLTLNGRCVVDPNDFAEMKQEDEAEIKFVLDFLRNLASEPLTNFRTFLCEMTLKFRIIDDNSRQYALKFLASFPQKLQRLTLSECQITSNIFAQILPGYVGSVNFCERMKDLQELNLSKNFLNDDVFTTISKLMKTTKKLHLLNLNQNSISFEKQSIVSGFLTSIVNIKLKLYLSKNSIKYVKSILRYLVNAQGIIPLEELDISQNPISSEDLSTLTKAYLHRVKQTQNCEFKLHLKQLQFEQPHAFQFLQEQYRFKKPNTVSIPMSISKHAIKKKGKQIADNTEQQLSKLAKIDQLIKNYGYQVFRGDFYKLNKIRAQLLTLGLDEEAFIMQTQKYSQFKAQQEFMLIRKIESCLNLEVQPQNIMSEISQALKFCRRKGIIGSGFNMLAYIKSKIEQTMSKYESQSLGLPYKQQIYLKKGRFKLQYQKISREMAPDFQKLLQMNQRQLMREYLQSDKFEYLQPFMTYHYLLSQKPQNYNLLFLQSCLLDPRMSALKISRFERDNIIQIYEKIRVDKNYLKIGEAKMGFLSTYSIQTYRFSKTFIESGISSSNYTGMLSRSKIEAEQQKIILSFIEITKNFLKFLYYTPDQLSDNVLIYLNSIVSHLDNLQNEAENDLKSILAEEFFIHFMTFYDSNRYKPLKEGTIWMICYFIIRRINLEEDILKRVAVYILKNQKILQDNLKLHISTSRQPWEGKIDWKITDLESFKNIITRFGKIDIKVADISHPELLITLQVDEADTVLEIWHQVKLNLNKLSEVTNINQSNIDYYWICGVKGQLYPGNTRFLPSFQHIGKLIFDQKYENKLYLKRVVYRPEQHSFPYLQKAHSEQLVEIFQQAKQGIKNCGSFLPKQEVIQIIILMIWIDILLMEELLLVNLRRQNDQESNKKYMIQRERIINECISKLYSRYIPVDFTLDQASRMDILFTIGGKKIRGDKHNINQNIRQDILQVMRKVGIIAYTVVFSDQQDKFKMLINNHEIVFVDKSSNEPKILQVKFRNILWFQFVVQQKLPILKFQIVSQIGQQNMKIHKFSIQGDSLWIGQCFAIITQIAKNRLSYPTQLLFLNEDAEKSMSDCKTSKKNKTLLSFPVLDINKYFCYSLPRKLDIVPFIIMPPKQNPQPIPKQKPPVKPSIQSEPKPQFQPQPQQPQLKVEQNFNEQSKVKPEIPKYIEPFKPKIDDIKLNLPLIEEQSNAARSSKQFSDKNIEIEDIIQNTQKQGDEDIIITRRSANSKKQAPRRRSRNR